MERFNTGRFGGNENTSSSSFEVNSFMISFIYFPFESLKKAEEIKSDGSSPH